MEAEVEKTKQVLLETLDAYAFTDAALNLPTPYQDQVVNVRAEIEALEPVEGMGVYEFYSKIKKIFDSFRDSHFNFYIPCASTFHYILPVTFEITMNSEGNYETYASGADETIFPTGVKVVRIVTEDLETIENEEPHVTLARWGHTHNLDTSRSSVGRTALAPLTFCNRPLLSGESVAHNVTITYVDAETEEEKSAELEFLETSTASFASSAEVCPLVSEESKETGARSNREEALSRLQERVLHPHNRFFENLEFYKSFHPG